MMQVDLVKLDDWVILYVEGVKRAEGHEIDWPEILKVCFGYQVTVCYPQLTENQVSYGFHAPENLCDLEGAITQAQESYPYHRS